MGGSGGPWAIREDRGPYWPACSGVAMIDKDPAHAILVDHLSTTETLYRRALRELDPHADCQIRPAADLGVPYDVIRLAGGFATGCVIDWTCHVPVVPVDTTMNIDTSSVFWLDGDPSGVFTEQSITRLRTDIEERSSYEWNFDSGNHFLSYCWSPADDRHALVLHSNEKEFKNQYNGLCPTQDNWFADSIRSFGQERPIRLLIGPKAKLFTQLAHMLEEFNILRHRFLATMLLGESVAISSELHKHHYFMPTVSSAAIGCYLCDLDEEVPLFSELGGDISFFRPHAGGGNVISLASGEVKLIVPHGWGMTWSRPTQIRHSSHVLEVNGRKYPVEAGVSLLDDPDVVPRRFEGGPQEFLARIAHHTPGEIVSVLHQVASYSRHGFLRHVHEPGIYSKR